MSKRKHEREQFERGLIEGRDPGMSLTASKGVLLTGLESYWLHMYCSRTGHTIRVGDAIEIGADGKPCLTVDPDAVGDARRITDFVAGLERVWPPPGDVPMRRIMPGDSLLAPPLRLIRRAACAVCGHTVRAFEQVILCPCQPLEPLCALAIHRDPMRGLNCFDSWNPGEELQYCPATSRALKP